MVCVVTSLLVCVLFCAATSQAEPTHKVTSRPDVVVVGDSITDLASGSIEAALAPKYHPILVYHDGMRIDQMLPPLALALSADAHVSAVVENLGTNDALQGGRYADWRASWTRLRSMTAKVPCVVLTTINPTADAYGKRSIASAINRDVDQLAKSDPKRYKVVDWHQFLVEAWTKHRATFFDYLQREGIHERPPGARWLAEEDRSALAECGSSAQPSTIPPSKQLLDP